MDLAIALDGTITGEHGVGRLKKGWLPAYLGPDALALNHKIKNALDPQGHPQSGRRLRPTVDIGPTVAVKRRSAVPRHDHHRVAGGAHQHPGHPAEQQAAHHAVTAGPDHQHVGPLG